MGDLSAYERVIVTGATGWIGRTAVDMLGEWFGDALPSHAVLAATSGRQLATPWGVLDVCAMGGLVGLPPGPRTLLVHCGFPTQDRVDGMGADAYISAVGRLRVAIQHVIARLGGIDMIYLSSGAATSVERGVALADRTRVYGTAKLEDEATYGDAVTAVGGRLCVVRAFALSGPYMTKPPTYALGNMIMQARDTGSVTVLAPHPVRRSYMLVDDMLRLALGGVGSLGTGDHTTFETCGEVVEMATLASRVLAALGGDPQAVVRPTFDPNAPPDDYLGNPVAMNALVGASSVHPSGLDAQIAATAAWLMAQSVP